MSIVHKTVLLERIKDFNDQEAWNEFYTLYCPVIIGFVREQTGNDRFAYAVLQETICQVMKYVARFPYDDPLKENFRLHLFGIILRRITSLSRRMSVSIRISQSSTMDSSCGIGEWKESSLWQSFDRLWKKRILLIALDRVKEQSNTIAWVCFEMYVLDGFPLYVVARRLRLEEKTALTYKREIMKLVREEINRLEKKIGETW